MTNKAHTFQNQLKLEWPIKKGTKVSLENKPNTLLKSQKLLSLRSGPYTVIKKLRKTCTEFRKLSLTKKRHRNHIIEDFPTEQQMPKLL